jgi:hypothetical protein
MTNINQLQVAQGSAIIKGKVASQFQYGTQYIGCAEQWFILGKQKLLDSK